MIVEIVNTGTELLLGQTLNTHQQWLCRRLTDNGYSVARQVTVADTGEAICAAVKEALGRADLVLTTGGLGPTSDDITREHIAAMLDRPLREDAAVREQIAAFFTSRGRPVPELTRVEAMVPDGAEVLPNRMGTAPGLVIELDPNPFREPGRRSMLIMLPGPPRELYPMFDETVLPLLRDRLAEAVPFAQRTLRSTGVPESEAQRRVEPLLADLISRGLQVGYCARPIEVDVRLSARNAHAKAMVQEAESIVRRELSGRIYGENDAEMEQVVVRLLAERQQTLALAESCTGGLIGHRITNVPGASAVLLAGLVTYSNEAKQRFLGVPASLLREHGAVSEPVCRAMAEGARRLTGADHGLAVTGIAGPSGGTEEKPVGTVFLGLADDRGTAVEKRLNRWDRATFKRGTSQQALDLLRCRILGLAL